MKALRSFFISLFLVLIFCSAGIAQKEQKDMRGRALPENATLEETQSWIILAMTGNSAHRLKETKTVKDVLQIEKDDKHFIDTRISNVKFEGCQMSYTIENKSEVTQQRGITGGMGVGGGQMPMGAQTEKTKVTFKLSELDTNEITFKETEENGVMSVIALRTLDYKRVIKLSSKDTGNLTVSVASFMVGSNIAEQTKDALVHAVGLCRAE